MISASFPAATWCSSFCPNNAKIWYSLSTNVITSLNGIPADEEARPQQHVDHRAVAGRAARSSASGPTARSRAAPASCRPAPADDLDLRLRRRDLRLDLARRWRDRRLTRPAELLPDCCSAARAAADLRRELADVGLRLLEIEAVAGAGRHQLGVLRRRASAPAPARAAARDLAGGLVQLLFQLRARWTATSASFACDFGELRLVGADLAPRPRPAALRASAPRSGTASDRCGTARRPSSPAGCSRPAPR